MEIEATKPTLNKSLRDFWSTKARIKVLYGGRASSKTWDASGFAVYLAQRYRLKILCTRQFQNKISESVYATIKNQIERFGLSEQFKITNNKITHKRTQSEFIFLGLYRNIDEIKSLEGVDICWIEEAHNLSKEQWDILEPTIRKENSEFWIIFNPRARNDFVYKRFIVNTPDNCIKRKINYNQNPFLSSTLSITIENLRKEDYKEYEHIYLGVPRNEAYNSLFNYEEIRSMFDNKRDVSDEGNEVWGGDIARFGDDNCNLFKRSGYVGRGFLTWAKSDTMQTASKIIGEYNNSYKKPSFIFIDTIGVGAGVFDRLVQLGLANVVLEANASAKASDSKYFNKRTEMYFNLKEAIKKGFYTPKDDEVEEELMAYTYSYTPDGKIKLVSKEDIKKELGRSPDKADALALSFFEELPVESIANETYATHEEYRPEGSW